MLQFYSVAFCFCTYNMTSQITKSEVHAIVLFIALCAGLLKQLQWIALKFTVKVLSLLCLEMIKFWMPNSPGKFPTGVKSLMYDVS